MQSASSILEYPRSSSKITPKQNLETIIKQQKTDKSNNTAITNVQTSEDKAPSYGATKMFYKLTEYLAYTSSYTTSAISETYNTLMAGGTTKPEYSSRKISYNDSYHDDVMQIADDSDGAYYNEEISDGEIEYNDKKIDRKNESKWSENDDEYEPPPPYDSSWVMPKTNPEVNNLTDAPMSTSPKQVNFEAPNVESKPTSTTEDTNSTTTAQTIPIPKRRQIRVRRPRRLIRRKSASTEVSTPRGGGGKYDDPEELLLKVNDKLSDMIAQGRAALTSTVDVTEVEILLAEEREKEERIMKEVGAGRKGRKNAVDHDYLSSMSDGNLSSPEFFDYGYNAYSGHGSGFASPSGYDTPDYPPHGHYNTPSQFGSPGMQPYHHQTQGGYYPSNLGYGLNNNHNNHKFGENDFNQIPNHYYEQSPSGYVEPAIPKVFGNGPISAGFGGPVKFGGRYLNNNGGFSHYGHNFGFGSNGFRGNVLNNNRGFY